MIWYLYKHFANLNTDTYSKFVIWKDLQVVFVILKYTSLTSKYNSTHKFTLLLPVITGISANYVCVLLSLDGYVCVCNIVYEQPLSVAHPNTIVWLF